MSRTGSAPSPAAGRRPQKCRSAAKGRRLNGFLGLSLNDRNIIFFVILLDKTV